MKTTLKFIFTLAIIIGFTANGFSQKKQTTIIIKKHKSVPKVIYTIAHKKNIKPTIDKVVYQLPRSARKVFLNKFHYIKHNNVLYTKVLIRGKHAYKVVRYS
jgi:hypothetical protein